MKILILGLLASTMAFSMLDRSKGDWGSGGGNAIVCFEETTIANGETTINILDEIKNNKNIIPDKFLDYIESIEMYDLFEAKKRRGFSNAQPEILSIKNDEKFFEYIDRVTNRYDKYVYTIGGIVGEGQKLLPESQFVFNESGVKYQNDLGSVTLPGANCLVSTMAAQVNYSKFFEAHIDSRLFNHPKHSRQSKATLILHEIVYATARRHFKHQDSGATRSIVRYLISYHESITERRVAEAIYSLNLKVKRSQASDVLKINSSNTMYVIQTFTENLIKDINMQIRLIDSSEGFKSLELELQRLVKIDRTDMISGNDRFSNLVYNIKIGLEHGESKALWRKLYEDLTLFIDLYNKSIKSLIASSNESMFRELRVFARINHKDSKNLKRHLFGYYKYNSNILLTPDSSIETELSSGLVVEELFASFFYSSGCDELGCYEELELSSIIPKE